MNPQLPKEWNSLSLQICFRGYRLSIHVNHELCKVDVDGSEGKGRAHLVLQGKKVPLIDGQTLELPLSHSPQTVASAAQ